MGLILGICFLEIVIFLLYLPHSTLYWPIPFVFIYFMFWYMLDDTETNGNRSWNLLRNLNFWQKKFTAVEYFFGDKKSIVEQSPNSRLVFVVVKGNLTNMALISGFGLHGGMFQELDICYILPWVLFKVPILREIIMWTGAISGGKGSISTSILTALNHGKSVCFAMNGMNELTTINDEQTIPIDLFEFAKLNKIKLVPVNIENECERYSIWKYPSLHKFSLAMFGFPFPFIFFPKIFGEDPPPKVDIRIGIQTDPLKYDNVKEFSKHFFLQITGIV